MAFNIKIPYVISTHIKKFTSTTAITNKSKAAGIGLVSGVPYIHNGTAVKPLAAAVSGTAYKFAAGVGTLVTGTLSVATGLAGVVAFTANPTGQPTGTGAASHQILVPTFTGTTGAVTVTGYAVTSVTGATTVNSTSTGSFAWSAFGT